jgi:hypothetical protein
VAITLTTTPTYALPSDAVPLTATVNTAANFLRLWCVDAPVGSALRKLIDKSSAARVELAPPNAPTAGGFSPGVVFDAQLEVGGRYTFIGQEYTLGATMYGGGYSNAPDAFKTETPIGAEQTLTVDVGQRMTHRLGCSAYGTAQLLVYVWGGYIRETTMEIHRVVSPAIINASTPRALSSASASGVLTQLALFTDADVTTLVTNLQTLVNELTTDLPLHFTNDLAVYHGSADSDNGTEISDLPTQLSTPNAVSKAAAVLYSRFRNHMSNGATGASHYHRNGADYAHALICDPTPSEADMAYTFAIIADVVRCYEAHRVDVIPHLVADNNHPIVTALGPLLSLHRAFFDALASFSPTVAGGVQPGVVKLGSYGFKLES